MRLKSIPQLGTRNPRTGNWDQTDEQRCRPDIDVKKWYLVSDNDKWYTGKFVERWYGWVFHPAAGCISMQIEYIDAIWEIESFPELPVPLATHRPDMVCEVCKSDDVDYFHREDGPEGDPEGIRSDIKCNRCGALHGTCKSGTFLIRKGRIK